MWPAKICNLAFGTETFIFLIQISTSHNKPLSGLDVKITNGSGAFLATFSLVKTSSDNPNGIITDLDFIHTGKESK